MCGCFVVSIVLKKFVLSFTRFSFGCAGGKGEPREANFGAFDIIVDEKRLANRRRQQHPRQNFARAKG